MTTELTKAAPAALDITIEGEGAKVLHAMTAPAIGGDNDHSPIRLAIGDGHSGHGLYVAHAEYPEEGVELVVSIPKDTLTQHPSAQTEREAFERCAQWCDEQARSDWHGRKASDMVRAFASLPAPQQATPEPVTLGPLAKRNIYDAIRGAYDLGYNDARNARTVPGDSAPGYDGRSVEEDHGGALFNLLSKRLTPATPEPVGEPVGTVVHATLNGQAKPWVTVALNQDADLPNGTKLFTRPAPGVPDVQPWQPIETAPKDGTIVDLWAHPYTGSALRLTDVWWTERTGWRNGACCPRIAELAKRATHWTRPPAAPPLAAAQAKGGAA